MRENEARLLGNDTIAILCAVAAATVFSLNDLGIKFLSGEYALHQVILMRAVIALSITVAFIMPMEGGYALMKTRRPGMHLLRGIATVLANMTFFLGLAAMPLPEATAIFFVSPLIITLFSVVFLKEHVGPQRWMAVAIGLIGVVIMLRPGTSAFQMAALLPVASAVLYAALHTMTRSIGTTERASTMAFYIQVTFIAVSLAMGLAAGDGRFGNTGDPSMDFLLRAWTWPPAGDLAIIFGIGLCSAIGGYLISQAYRLSQAALIAPYEYVAMPLAIFWGLTVFGDWPDAIAWTGIALIVGSGLFVFLREAYKGRRLASGRPLRR